MCGYRLPVCALKYDMKGMPGFAKQLLPVSHFVECVFANCQEAGSSVVCSIHILTIAIA